jgi:hypothetical protein
MAEFDDEGAVIEAANRCREAGYVHMDAYSPYPVEGLPEALGLKPTRLPIAVFFMGILGCALGFLLEYWTQGPAYPINIGGRALFSYPAFVPPAYECTILFSALTAAFGMIIRNDLPLPYHPVFNIERFKSASKDGFFLCIESEDPKFEKEKTKKLLESLKPRGVYEVDK